MIVNIDAALQADFDEDIGYGLASGGVGIRDLGQTTENELEVTFPNIKVPYARLLAMELCMSLDKYDRSQAYSGIDFGYGTIQARLSVDDGVSYLFYTPNAGSNHLGFSDTAGDGTWATAGASDWSTLAELNHGLESIPYGATKCTRVQFLLTRGAMGAPILHTASFIGDMQGGACGVDDYEDIHRTIIDLVRQMCMSQVCTETSDGTNVVSYNSEFKITEVLSIYNITTDPARLTNIAAGTFTNYTDKLNPVNTMDLTVTPTAGDVIEYSIEVAPADIILAHSDPKIRTDADQHAPIVIVQINRADDLPDNRLAAGQKTSIRNFGTAEGFETSNPVTLFWETVSHCVAKDELQAVKMAKGVSRAVQNAINAGYDNQTKMFAQPYEVLPMTIPFQNFTDSSEQASVKAVLFDVKTLAWSGIIERVPLFLGCMEIDIRPVSAGELP